MSKGSGQSSSDAGVASAKGPPSRVSSYGPITEVGPQKQLSFEELTDVIDLALWTGALLLEHGAAAPFVEKTMILIGTSLGCDRLDVLISPSVIMATSTEGHLFRTKLRRIGGLHVNLERVVIIGEIARAVAQGRYDRAKLRAKLTALQADHHSYPQWVVAVAVGLACAAFSRLFGGDWRTFAVVFVAASCAATVRHFLAVKRFTPVLIVFASSLLASTLAAVGVRLVGTTTPGDALAAAVLLLVPGVPLINAFEEMVKGYILIAVARGLQGLVISFAIALGLLLAMRSVGVIVL